MEPQRAHGSLTWARRLTRLRADPYRSYPNDLRAKGDRTVEHAVMEGVRVSTDHWIGGERVASDDRFDDVSPIDESVIAAVARGGERETTAAVGAARRGFEAWGATPPKERAATLHRIADGIEARVPELAAVETRDNGSLLRSMRNSVMPRVARNFRSFADALLRLEGSADRRSTSTRNGSRGTRRGRPR